MIVYGFLDDFLQLYLFCFICSTKFVNAVQKSVAVFEGVGVGEGGRGVYYHIANCRINKCQIF